MSDTQTKIDTSAEACALACMLVSNPGNGLRPLAWKRHVNDLIRALRDERNTAESALAVALVERDRAREAALPPRDVNNLDDIVAYLGIEDSDDTLVEAIVAMKDQLFGVIAHGDETHRAWLKQALDDFFLKDRRLPAALSLSLSLPPAPNATEAG